MLRGYSQDVEASSETTSRRRSALLRLRDHSLGYDLEEPPSARFSYQNFDEMWYLFSKSGTLLLMTLSKNTKFYIHQNCKNVIDSNTRIQDNYLNSYLEEVVDLLIRVEYNVMYFILVIQHYSMTVIFKNP